MKRALILLFLLLPSLSYAEKPVIAVAGISSDGVKSSTFAAMLENNLMSILYMTEKFDFINNQLLRSELAKFNVSEDRGILSFAKDAKISVIVKGDIIERGNDLEVTLRAYGVDIPYQGKIVAEYRSVATFKKGGAANISDISDEHAARFITLFLSKYRHPLYLDKDKKAVSDFDRDSEVYRVTGSAGDLRLYERAGSLADYADKEDKNAFVLEDYKSESSFIDSFYYGRKKEMLFTNNSALDTGYVALFTPVVSPLMPFAAPLSYYIFGDYEGLLLWSLNSTPYIYLSAKGMINRPSKMRRDGKDIEHFDHANYWFSYYHTYVAGMAFIADIASHHALNESSNYTPFKSFVGNDYTAFYLSAVTSGGGHFYRGYRYWGYFYYHLDNILIYSALYNFSKKEIYDSESAKYRVTRGDRRKGYISLAALGAVKTVEIIHSMFLRDRIANGEWAESSYSIAPSFDFSEGEMIAGFNYTYYF